MKYHNVHLFVCGITLVAVGSACGGDETPAATGTGGSSNAGSGGGGSGGVSGGGGGSGGVSGGGGGSGGVSSGGGGAGGTSGSGGADAGTGGGGGAGPTACLGGVTLCARATDSVRCSPSTGIAFGAWDPWQTALDDASGWNSSASRWGTIQFSDVNGDGRADLCARASDGIRCSLSTGTAFGTWDPWQTALDDAGGWNTAASQYSTIQFPDVNGDGKADLCARASDGIRCSLSTGTAFGAWDPWQNALDDAGGWNTEASQYSTIQFPDVNGDGKADLCARASDGIRCSLSTGTAFGTWDPWQTALDNAGGWNTEASQYSTIQFPDVNGDGKADLCARASDGIRCSLSTGTAFGTWDPWQTALDNAGGWNTEASQYSTIQFPDVNGDGKADLCARASDSLRCSLSTGTAPFGTWEPWQNALANGGGWNTEASQYSTIQFPDVNSDGKADLCARASDSFRCSLSTGTAPFGTWEPWQNALANGGGWDTEPSQYSTIRVTTAGPVPTTCP